jgi:ubiquinone/menaquinone biosynthesis C-methylase UbiE
MSRREWHVSETWTARSNAFDDIFLAYERSSRLPTLMRLALDETLPPEVQPYSFVTMPALHEITRELRLVVGDLLVDLACGRGGPGLWVAHRTGARLLGIDFSTVALAQARRRALASPVADRASFEVGDLAATGLPDASTDALMCIDSFQFAHDMAQAASEAWRILRPGGRFVLTCWEPREAGRCQLPDGLARLDFGATLSNAGFVDIRVEEREGWHRRQRVVLERVLASDPGDDGALAQLRGEAARMLPLMDLQRRVIVTAVHPH